MTTADRVTEAYDTLYETMRLVAAWKFRIPDADIRPLIHDVFLAYLRNEAVVGDPRSWLVAAVCNACRNYWRAQRTTEVLADDLLDPQRVADEVSARIDVARVLAQVPERCRTILWLRYVDGLDPVQIAARCADSESSGYARQLVHRCLKAARQALATTRRDAHVRPS